MTTITRQGPAAIWARSMLRSNAVILDSETTGLEAHDQMIQLGMIDMQGNVLFDSLLKPTCRIHPGAAAVNGLTAAHVANAPTIGAVLEQIQPLLLARPVIIYNADFDSRMLGQSLAAYNLDRAWCSRVNFQCAMRVYGQMLGTRRWVKLEGGDHSALGDCRATLALLKRMAG